MFLLGGFAKLQLTQIFQIRNTFISRFRITWPSPYNQWTSVLTYILHYRNHFVLVVTIIPIVWLLSARRYIPPGLKDHAEAIVSVQIPGSSYCTLDARRSYSGFDTNKYTLEWHCLPPLSHEWSTSIQLSVVIVSLLPWWHSHSIEPEFAGSERCNVLTLILTLLRTKNVPSQALPFSSRKFIWIERMGCVSPQRIGEAFVPFSNLAIV